MFSEGQQQVQIRSFARSQGTKDNTCLFDPNSPLIIVHSPNLDTGDYMIAQVQGNPVGEWPFCTVHTEVLLKTHQVCQKPAVLRAVRDMLGRLFSR